MVQNQNVQKLFLNYLANGYSSFQKILDDVSQQIGVKIDPNVTMDIHRIFRLPGSINSKSGLTKILCTDITKFDPYTLMHVFLMMILLKF